MRSFRIWGPALWGPGIWVPAIGLNLLYGVGTASIVESSRSEGSISASSGSTRLPKKAVPCRLTSPYIWVLHSMKRSENGEVIAEEKKLVAIDKRNLSTFKKVTQINPADAGSYASEFADIIIDAKEACRLYGIPETSHTSNSRTSSSRTSTYRRSVESALASSGSYSSASSHTPTSTANQMSANLLNDGEGEDEGGGMSRGWDLEMGGSGGSSKVQAFAFGKDEVPLVDTPEYPSPTLEPSPSKGRDYEEDRGVEDKVGFPADDIMVTAAKALAGKGAETPEGYQFYLDDQKKTLMVQCDEGGFKGDYLVDFQGSSSWT